MSASRGTAASIFVSIVPREMCSAPGMRPRFTSCWSRTSRKVTPPRLWSASASTGLTSLMRDLASLIRSVPLFIGAPVWWWRQGAFLKMTDVTSVRQHVQRACIGVELGAGSKRDRPLVADVAERDAGQILEGAGEPQLLQHAIDAIGRLANVLEHKDGPGVIRRVLRAGERGEQRKVSTDEPAGGTTATQRARSRCDAAWIGL